MRLTARLSKAPRMAVFPRATHTVRTQAEPRDADIYQVRIGSSRVENASGTVKSFAFQFQDAEDVRRFSFKAGQWLDVFIPGQAIVGGYSLISAPQEISQAIAFELAIKDSSHPPARWFHEKAEIGSPVAVRVGGSFFYEPTAGVENVVFLAAGVGINPLLSMLRSIRHSKKRPSRVQLLYASKADDLLFLDQVQACLPTKDVQLFITQPPSLRLAIPPAFERIHNRRFTAADVRAAIPSPQETAVYLCGPAQMTDEYEAILCGEGGLGLDRNRVFFERWW